MDLGETDGMAAPSDTARSLGGHERGLLLVLAAGVLWSSIGLGVRLIEDATVWQLLLYRSASLSLFLYVVIRLRSKESPFDQVRRVGLPVIIAGLSLVLAFAGGIYAIQTTSVANAMLLFGTSPLLAAALGWLLLREPVRKATGLACLIAIAGIAIMVADKSSGGALRGSLAALGAAFGFAAFTVSLRWGKSEEMLPAVFLSGIFAVVLSLAICMTVDLPLVLSLRDAGVAVGMGVFQVGAGLILYTMGSRSLPAAELALLSLAEVVLAPLWVWILLGETATANTLIGGSIVLAALAGNALSGAKRRPPPISGP